DSVIFGPQRDMYVLGTNETLVYDFETDQVSSPYKDGYESHDIRTVIEGLNEVLPNGDVFIEESKYGRLLVMSKSGDIRWSYVNRAENGTVYILHWSRYINGELAQALRNTFAETAACED
ncbi:MAG: arylsulfotransferase family protein, partial [Hyphomonas sp.]|nr:arylsulfotransferase family protein [Hyphomonas sp.]